MCTDDLVKVMVFPPPPAPASDDETTVCVVWNGVPEVNILGFTFNDEVL